MVIWVYLIRRLNMITIPSGFTLYINIAVAAFYLLFLVMGSRRGFLRQIIAVAGLLISGFLAVRYYVLLASYIHIVPWEWLPLQDTMIADMVAGYANEAVWFLILFLVFRLLPVDPGRGKAVSGSPHCRRADRRDGTHPS